MRCKSVPSRKACLEHHGYSDLTINCECQIPVKRCFLALIKAHLSRRGCTGIRRNLGCATVAASSPEATRSYMTISWGGSILGPKLMAPTGLTSPQKWARLSETRSRQAEWRICAHTSKPSTLQLWAAHWRKSQLVATIRCDGCGSWWSGNVTR